MTSLLGITVYVALMYMLVRFIRRPSQKDRNTQRILHDYFD